MPDHLIRRLMSMHYITEMQKMKHDNEQAIDSLSKELERTQELFNDAQGRLESTSTELERESASHKNMRERLRESEVYSIALIINKQSI